MDEYAKFTETLESYEQAHDTTTLLKAIDRFFEANTTINENPSTNNRKERYGGRRNGK